MKRVMTQQDNTGAALILSLVFVIVLVAMTGVLTTRIIMQSRVTQHLDSGAQALAAAESALALARAGFTMADGPRSIGVAGWNARDGEGGLRLPRFGDAGVTPQPMPGVDGCTFYALVLNWAEDGLDNNGDGAVDDPAEAGYWSIHAFARLGTASRGVEEVLTRAPDAQGIERVAWRIITPPDGE